MLGFKPLAVEVSHRLRSRLATNLRRLPLLGACHALPICVAMWEERRFVVVTFRRMLNQGLAIGDACPGLVDMALEHTFRCVLACLMLACPDLTCPAVPCLALSAWHRRRRLIT